MKTPRTLASWSLCFLATLTCLCANAQEWPRFRGPNGSGVSPAADPPLEMDGQHNLRWKSAVPFARSSPVLAEGVVFLSAADEKSLITLCLDCTSGALRWQRRIERTRRADRYKGNDSASPSPVTDGENVYVFFQEFGLVSYDRAGKLRWTRPLGPFRSYYGMSSSPILAGDLLLLLCDQQSGSYLLACGKDDGEVRWKAARPGLSESWTTPVLFPSASDPRQVITFGNFQIHGYDLATGKELWCGKGLGAGPVSSPIVAGTRLFVCVPYAAEQPVPPFTVLLGVFDKNKDGKIARAEIGKHSFADHFGWADRDSDGFLEPSEWEGLRAAMTCKDHGLVALDLAGVLQGGEARELWRYKKSLAEIATPLLYRGVLYMIKDGGILTALDPASGKVLKRARIAAAAGECWPSPVAAAGRIYLASNAGRITVLAAGPGCEELATSDLGEEINATPAIGGDGALYIRTAKTLYCFARASERKAGRGG